MVKLWLFSFKRRGYGHAGDDELFVEAGRDGLVGGDGVADLGGTTSKRQNLCIHR
jgi:hypothetical protein